MGQRAVHFPSAALSMSKGEALRLEGMLHLPEGHGPFPGVVMCHPHPAYSGSMDNNVVMAVCQGLVRQGIAALRFNFRGVGGSGGSYGSGSGEQDDARAALAFLAGQGEIDTARLGLAGYSYGASVALAVTPSLDSVQALASISCPAPSLSDPALASYARPKLIMSGGMDVFCPIEQVELMVGCMAGPKELRIVPDADHFWLGHEGLIAQVVGDFFARHLKGLP